jgi:hypothetical protein
MMVSVDPKSFLRETDTATIDKCLTKVGNAAKERWAGLASLQFKVIVLCQ